MSGLYHQGVRMGQYTRKMHSLRDRDKGTHQAVTITKSNRTRVRLVLQVTHVVAVGQVWMAPGHMPLFPVFHAELPREQSSL